MRARSSQHTSKRRTGERGAALVEFAVLAPLLVILVFGIVEFGYKFGQFNDVRHAAREAARFATVNSGDNAAIEAIVCDALEGLGADITKAGLRLDPGAAEKRGAASLTLVIDVGSLSNLPIITDFLPDQLRSEVNFRLEQDVDWTAQNLAADSTTWTEACP